MRTFVLIRSFLKKSLTQVIALILLFLFSSMLLNVFLYIQMDYEENFYRTSDMLESEDICIIYYNLINEDQKENVKKSLDSLDYVENYEIEGVVTGAGAIDFNEGELDNYITVCSFKDIKNKAIGKYEILNDINGEGVILSYLFKVSGGYEINDTISFRIYENEYKCKIVGFYNNVTTGTMNCPDLTIIATDNVFNEIKKDANPSLRIELNTEEEAINDIVDKLEEDVPCLAYLYSNNLDTIKDNRYSNATLFRVILSAASIVMIIVMLIIIFITLTNYIRNTTRDLGTLKSIGYTSSGLIIPIVLVLTLISLVSSMIGSALSYLILPTINKALESQIGIPYHIHFQLVPFILCAIFISFITFMVSLLSVMKIKKIAPINAIRENKATTHKAAKVISLEKTHIEVNSLIGLKGFFSSVGRNIVILVAITAVSFLAGFTCFMYQNVIKDNSHVLELICGQIADSTLTVETVNEDKLLDELKKDDDVDSYYLFSIASITPKEYPIINAYIYEDESYLNKDIILLEGSLPKKDMEIAINGAYAKENNLNVGDSMGFETEKGLVDLKVSGITQGAYYAGSDSFVLRDTYEKMDDLYAVSYYVDLKDGVDVDEFNTNMYEDESKFLKNYINQEKYLQSTAAVYSSILYVLAYVICALAILIVVIVLYILIYILLKNKRREHGILKSIGYTSKEIIYQTILTIIPTCVIAIIIGLACSKNGVKELLSYALQSVGIFSFGQPIHTLYLLIAGILLIVFAILYTLVLSLSIKKIAPHDLFNNE